MDPARTRVAVLGDEVLVGRGDEDEVPQVLVLEGFDAGERREDRKRVRRELQAALATPAYVEDQSVSGLQTAFRRTPYQRGRDGRLDELLKDVQAAVTRERVSVQRALLL